MILRSVTINSVCPPNMHMVLLGYSLFGLDISLLWFHVHMIYLHLHHFDALFFQGCFAGIEATIAWWRHQMEPFSALLALCAGNSPVPVNSPHKGQWRGALMFSLIYKRLSKQPWGWWFETPPWSLWRQCNGVGTVVWLPLCHQSNPGGMGNIDHYMNTTKYTLKTNMMCTIYILGAYWELSRAFNVALKCQNCVDDTYI